MEEVFRVRARFVMGELLSPLLLCSLMLVPGASSRKNAGIYLIAGICIIWHILRRTMPLLTSRLSLDTDHIQFVYGKQYFNLEWKDIEVIRINREKKETVLSLTTVDHNFIVPIQYYESGRIIELVKEYAKHEAFDEDACVRLPGYHELRNEMDALISNGLIIKDAKSLAVLGWGTFLIFVPVSILAWLTNGGPASFIFLFFGLLGLVLVFNHGTTEINEQTITRKTYGGTFQMRWNEIECIQVTPLGDEMILIGGGKQLSLPGGSYWQKTNREKYVCFFFEWVQKNGIKVEKRKSAAFKWTKNCRI